MIESERLLLRPPLEGDIDAVARAFGDREVMRFVGVGSTRTLAQATEALAAMRRAWETDGFGQLTVVRRDDRVTLGWVGFLVWDPLRWRTGTRSEIGAGAEIELAWTLARQAWGRGYATEAALAARDWGLRELGTRRLISLIYPENSRSIRVAAKLGERYEREITTERGIALQLWALPGVTQGAPAHRS